MCDCEERDFVTFTDDDGNDFDLDVIDYFDYNGKEYAVLIDPNDNCECDEDEECDCETSIYIMSCEVIAEEETTHIGMTEEEDTEEFVSPADEDMDALIEIVQARLEDMDDECCCDDDCDCDCGCHKE